MARKPSSRSQRHDDHSQQPASRNDRSRSRRDRAEDLLDAASDAGRGSGWGGLLSRLPYGQMLKTAFLAYVAVRGGGALATFWNELKNGTPYDLRDKSKPTDGVDTGKAAVTDAVLDKNLSTTAGKNALEGGKSVTDGLNSHSAADTALNASSNSAAGAIASQPEALQAGMKGQVIRVALPGQGDRTVDFQLQKAVNDKSALAEFQAGYSSFAKEKGLPAELPQGSSLSIGHPSAGMFSADDQTAREYRFLGDRDFERNRSMSGSLDSPGGAWRSEDSFKVPGYRFDSSSIAASSSDMVRAEGIEEQARYSRLITQERGLSGATEAAVTTPVSVGNRLLGHSAGSDFESFAKVVGAGEGASLVKAHDIETGFHSVGVKSAIGAVAIQSDQVDRVSSTQHKDGASVFVSLEAPKGSLGAFDRKGNFEGKEAASGAFESVGKAAKAAEKSPVLAAANDVGVEGRKAVYADLKPGNESLTTRIAYEGRVVDYHARNGSIVMVERDPQTHQPKDASIIRSQGIKLKDGQLELDPNSSRLLREHVDLASKGRSSEFGDRHPGVRQQFASLGEGESKAATQSASVEKQVGRSIDGGARGGELGVEPDRGGASRMSAIREAGIQEMNAPAPATAMPLARPKSAGMEIGG